MTADKLKKKIDNLIGIQSVMFEKSAEEYDLMYYSPNNFLLFTIHISYDNREKSFRFGGIESNMNNSKNWEYLGKMHRS